MFLGSWLDAHQALLLTGTGVTNQAAIHACGLNAEEAKRHFREAVASGEDGVTGPAAEALQWCEREVSRPSCVVGLRHSGGRDVRILVPCELVACFLEEGGIEVPGTQDLSREAYEYSLESCMDNFRLDFLRKRMDSGIPSSCSSSIAPWCSLRVWAERTDNMVISRRSKLSLNLVRVRDVAFRCC